MANQILQFKLLLMSPGDIEDERHAATEIIQYWNAQIGNTLSVNVDLVKWETHSQPATGMHPQKILNQQLVEEADFGIAVFWSKLGTPTDTHCSGTAEEIDGLLKKGAKVSIYISQKPIEQHATKSYLELNDYIDKIRTEALFQYYSSTQQFRELLLLHLTKTIIDLVFKEKGIEYNTNLSITHKQQTKPDIRIKTSVVLTPQNNTFSNPYLAITVQNHSDSSVFLGSVKIDIKNGTFLFYQRDAITGRFNVRQELRAGEAFSFHVDPVQLKSDVIDLEQIKGVSINDDIDRVYSLEDSGLPITISSMLSNKI